MTAFKQVEKLRKSYKRANYDEFLIKHRGVKIWNSMPTKIKEIKPKYFFFFFEKNNNQFAQKQYDSDLENC